MLTIYPSIISKITGNNYPSSNKINFPAAGINSDAFVKTTAQNSSNIINFTGCSPLLKNKDSIEKIIHLIKSKDIKRIALCSHKETDGDAAGSMIALFNEIKEATGKIADMFILNPLQENFKFIDSSRKIKVISKILGSNAIAEDITKKFGTYDLAISLDTATADLHDINIYEGIFKKAKHKVSIDHHNKTNGVFADINLTDTSAISTSQIIMQFIKPFGLNTERIKPKIAEPILMGLITDARQFASSVKRFIRDDVHQLKNSLTDKDFRKLIENICKLNPQEREIYRNILKNGIKYNDDKTVAHFVYNSQVSIPSTKNIIGHVFQEIAKSKKIKYYFAIITDSNGKTSASIRSKTQSIEKGIIELGGGGHPHACAISDSNKSPKELVDSISDKLIELENSSIVKLAPPPDTETILTHAHV